MLMKTIEEGNKLIAKFMGLNYRPLKYYTGWYKTKKDNLYFERICDTDGLKYHTSWDWLMPVVEKIQKTNLGDVIIHGKNLVEISYNKQTQLYFESSLLENTWLACVEFIEWFNNNKCL